VLVNVGGAAAASVVLATAAVLKAGAIVAGGSVVSVLAGASVGKTGS
jgi:hypothetical protein